MQSIVHVGDFALARPFIKDPEQSLRKWVRMLNEDVAELASEAPRSKAPKLEAYVHNYSQRVAILLAVLRGVGEKSSAESIQALASSLVESIMVREAVEKALANSPTRENDPIDFR